MPIFCISDLHLGDRGPRDNFVVGGREGRLFKFLDYVEANAGDLYILGDLFDWWQVNLSRSVRAYEKLLARFAEVSRKNQAAPTWVVGNHDNALEAFGWQVPLPGIEDLNARKPFTEVINGRTFQFMHGHEADPYCNSSNPGIGEITAIISGMLEDRHQGPGEGEHTVEDVFIGALEAVQAIWKRHSKRTDRRQELIDGVEKFRTDRNADVVIYGHTHEAGRIGLHHYNTGTWARDMDTFVRIEDDETTTLYEWSRDCTAIPRNDLVLQ